MHGFADQHLAQHRPDGRLAVAVAREGRAPRALEGEVAAAAVAVDELADQQCPAVAELRREVAELVAGIGLGDGRGALGQALPENSAASAASSCAPSAEAQLIGQSRLKYSSAAPAPAPAARPHSSRAVRGHSCCRV
jgi:hypothetical protein